MRELNLEEIEMINGAEIECTVQSEQPYVSCTGSLSDWVDLGTDAYNSARDWTSDAMTSISEWF